MMNMSGCLGDDPGGFAAAGRDVYEFGFAAGAGGEPCGWLAPVRFAAGQPALIVEWAGFDARGRFEEVVKPKRIHISREASPMM